MIGKREWSQWDSMVIILLLINNLLCMHRVESFCAWNLQKTTSFFNAPASCPLVKIHHKELVLFGTENDENIPDHYYKIPLDFPESQQFSRNNWKGKSLKNVVKDNDYYNAQQNMMDSPKPMYTSQRHINRKRQQQQQNNDINYENENVPMNKDNWIEPRRRRRRKTSLDNGFRQQDSNPPASFPRRRNANRSDNSRRKRFEQADTMNFEQRGNNDYYRPSRRERRTQTVSSLSESDDNDSNDNSTFDNLLAKAKQTISKNEFEYTSSDNMEYNYDLKNDNNPRRRRRLRRSRGSGRRMNNHGINDNEIMYSSNHQQQQDGLDWELPFQALDTLFGVDKDDIDAKAQRYREQMRLTKNNNYDGILNSNVPVYHRDQMQYEPVSSSDKFEIENKKVIKEQSWEERALAMERVPPRGVSAWGPSGAIGNDARTQALEEAHSEVKQAKLRIHDHDVAVANHAEDLKILKMDVVLQKRRLSKTSHGGMGVADQETLRTLDVEIDQKERKLRNTRSRAQAARERLSLLEKKHWALLALFDH